VTRPHDDNAADRVRRGLDCQQHGNRMDLKVVAILSLVGVAIWLSHIAAKKREKIHK